MEGFGGVLVMSLVMLLGSYIAGSIPLFFSLSEEKLQLVSVMGAGLLVGTALSVIIPEGMQTLNMAYRCSTHQSVHWSFSNYIYIQHQRAREPSW